MTPTKPQQTPRPASCVELPFWRHSFNSLLLPFTPPTNQRASIPEPRSWNILEHGTRLQPTSAYQVHKSHLCNYESDPTRLSLSHMVLITNILSAAATNFGHRRECSRCSPCERSPTRAWPPPTNLPSTIIGFTTPLRSPRHYRSNCVQTRP